MLTITNLSVNVEQKPILQDISMQFDQGKNYCIIGSNGSGKSSLAMSIMGHPKYTRDSGSMDIDGTDFTSMTPNERAQLGIFVAFQHIPEIQGVKVFEFLRSIYDAKHGSTSSFLQFKKIIEPIIQEIAIDKEFLRRDLNVGFSGGERRKLEILQLRLLEPRYIFLDEIDSGLDVDAFKAIGTILQKINTPQNSLIIITHLFSILEYVPVDHVYILEKGLIKSQGGASLIDKIKQEGFGK